MLKVANMLSIDQKIQWTEEEELAGQDDREALRDQLAAACRRLPKGLGSDALHKQQARRCHGLILAAC